MAKIGSKEGTAFYLLITVLPDFATPVVLNAASFLTGNYYLMIRIKTSK